MVENLSLYPKTICPDQRHRQSAITLDKMCASAIHTLDPKRYLCAQLMPSILAFLIIPTTLQADQLIVNRINYTGANITGFEHGRLRFQAADGRKLEVWIEEIEIIVVDRGSAFADFNQAERYLANGEPAKSIVRYQRSMRLNENFWLRLVIARMLIAMDRAVQLDKAVATFIQLVHQDEAGANLAARIFPKNTATKLRGQFNRAVDQLEAELRSKIKPYERALFALLRFDLLQRSGDERAVGAAMEAISLTIPKLIQTELVYSIMAQVIETAMDQGKIDEALAGLDHAILYCPESSMPELLWLKGRALEKVAASQEMLIRASWPYLRVAIHYPEHPLVPACLYQAAELLHRMGRLDQAVSLLQECLLHQRLNADTKQRVDKALVQWRS